LYWLLELELELALALELELELALELELELALALGRPCLRCCLRLTAVLPDEFVSRTRRRAHGELPQSGS